MPAPPVTFTVFTKPWTMPLPELARHVASLGFSGVELPVRPGFQVEPDRVAQDLPVACRILADHGLRIASVAGPTHPAAIATYGDCGIPVVRICVSIERDEPYLAAEERLRRDFDAMLPALERHGVTLGIQNHCGRSVANAMGLLHLIEAYDPRRVGAVLDAGHNGLMGEEPELAVDIVWDRLCMVNLKSALWQRTNGPEAPVAEWRPYWTTGRHGLSAWPRYAAALRARGYDGVICLTAEYDDHQSVNRLIAEDLSFACELLR